MSLGKGHMKNNTPSCILAFVLAAILAAPCLAEDDAFDIERFQIEGNTLLPEDVVLRAVAPQLGPKRVYGDIQKALEALEQAYRRVGYSTVQVFVPEQELTGGVVRLLVTEGVIGKVVISGNKYFDERNIRAGLPTLKEGRAPNLRQTSEDIQLSNDSPAKQLEVTLGVSEEEGKVDAKVVVTEDNPQRAFMTMDSTGTRATGRSRVGVAYQHANLFNRDHNLTLAYTGSADAPTGVRVDIFSIGYRIPFYTLGDSLDFIYGKSGVNTPSSSPSLGGSPLGIVGKGDVFGMRWNQHLPRRGEYTSKLVYGYDYKFINSRCTNAGEPASIDPPTPPIASCVPYTTRPVSVTYSGQRLSPGQMFDYNIGLARNFPLGSQYTNSASGLTDNYSYLVSGNRSGNDRFTILRLGGSFLKAFQSDWQLRVAINSQIGGTPLVAAEQFGLAGSTAVRGFTERATSADSGYVVINEIYTPELGKTLGSKGSLRVLAFYDFARGHNYGPPEGALIPTKIGVASVGTGLRFSQGKDFSVRFDLAQVIDAGPANTKNRGDWRGHFNLMLAF